MQAAPADVDQVARHRGSAAVDLFLYRLPAASDAGDDDCDEQRMEKVRSRSAMSMNTWDD